MTLKDLSVKKFIDLYDIQQATFFETPIDKEIALLTCLFDKPEAFFLEMNLKEFTKWRNELNFISIDGVEPKPLRYIRANGRVYAPCYKFVSEVTGGMLVDSTRFASDKDKIIENLPQILASFCLPTKKTFYGRKKLKYNVDVPHEEAARDMEEANIFDAYSIALFFWAVWKGSLEVTGHSLVRKIIAKKKATKTPLTKEETEGLLHILQMSSGGTIQ